MQRRSRLSLFRLSRNTDAASTSGNALTGSVSSSSIGSFSSLESVPPPNQLAHRNYGATLRRDVSDDEDDHRESPSVGTRRMSQWLDTPPTPRTVKRLKTFSSQLCTSLNLQPDVLDNFVEVLSCSIFSFRYFHGKYV